MSEVTITTEETPASAITLDNDGNAITTDNDVAIAVIEAEKAVTIAQIEADASVAREESYSDARVAEAQVKDEGNNELWQTINRLASTVEILTAKVETLQTITEPALARASLEEVTEEIAETVSETLTETDLTQVSTSIPPSEMQTEVSAASEEESLIPPLVSVDRKPLIKLV
jgi:predicted TIM-barrel enzyme